MTLNKNSSDTIKLARFTCIFFMCFVHIYGQEYIGPSGLGAAYIVIAEILGRASVPLLSAISGYLAVVSLRNVLWPTIIITKIKSLILPMVTWNIIAIVFAISVFWLSKIPVSFYETIQGKSILEIIYQNILALNYESVQQSHNFLRDIFFCFALFPVFLMVVRFGRIFGVIAFTLIVLKFSMIPFVYREHIVIFFILGIFLADKGVQIESITRFWYVSVPFIIIILAGEFYPFFYTEMSIFSVDYNFFKRVVVSFSMLCICYYIAFLAPKTLLTHLSEITFVAFLAHNIVFAIVWVPFKVFINDSTTVLYVLYFFVAPIILWLLASVAIPMIKKCHPLLQLALSGKSR